jgi:tRNA-specific 2-thiouridylase
VERDGRPVGSVDSIELVTLGQRRGLELGGDGDRRYADDNDHVSATVTVGPWEDLLVAGQRIERLAWSHLPLTGDFLVQGSAHGRPEPARLDHDHLGPLVVWHQPQGRVAPGQSLALYHQDRVVGGGTAGPAVEAPANETPATEAPATETPDT